MELQSAKKWSLKQFCTNSITILAPLAQTDVGRAKSSDLCLEWVFLSPRHAAFVVNCYGNLLLRDLHSNGGTFVNSQLLPICKNKALAHGDIVSFGMAHYLEHSMSKEIKKCFFEVIADDRPSTMSILLMVGDLTVDNSGQSMIQSSGLLETSTNEGKANPSTKKIDPSKELATALTVAKETKEVQPIIHSSEGEKKTNNETIDLITKPAECPTASKDPVKLSRKKESVNLNQITDLFKQNAEIKNKAQPIKPSDSSKVLPQSSTFFKAKNAVQPLKTFNDLIKCKEVSVNTIKPTAFPRKTPSDVMFIKPEIVPKGTTFPESSAQPIKSSKENVNPIKSFESLKIQAQQESWATDLTLFREKKTTQSIKTLKDFMSNKGKENSVNSIKSTELPSNPQNRRTNSDVLVIEPAEIQPKPLDPITTHRIKITGDDFKSHAQPSTSAKIAQGFNINNKLVNIMSVGGKPSLNVNTFNLPGNSISILKEKLAQTNNNKHQLNERKGIITIREE